MAHKNRGGSFSGYNPSNGQSTALLKYSALYFTARVFQASTQERSPDKVCALLTSHVLSGMRPYDRSAVVGSATLSVIRAIVKF